MGLRVNPHQPEVVVRQAIPILGGLVVSMCLAACGPAAPTPPPTLDPQSPAGRGRRLFQADCAACHALEAEVVIVGPSLAGVAERAGQRVSGLAAEDYLRASILRPDEYIVAGFQAGSMRQDFGTALTSEEVADLLAYLTTLK